MASLRSIASCIGITGTFSVIGDFFGYRTGVFVHDDLSIDLTPVDAVEPSIDPSLPGELSLLNQLKLLKGPHVHLDIIHVGPEDFTETDNQEIDVAVQVTRELLGRHGLGVGRIRHSQIPKDEANGFTSVDTRSEAVDLVDQFHAPGWGIDVFFVRNLNFGAAGATPVKDTEGVVIGLQGNMNSGIALAHELGHYLWEHEHHKSDTNLMFASLPKPPYDLTSGQLAAMKSHPDTKKGCR